MAAVLQKKIALLGVSGVGKTSLVRRYVQSLFDDKYLTTIGVKVDKKQVQVGAQDVTLMLWDVAGAEDHFAIPTSYIRGAAGYLLVVDGTRPDTLQRGLEIVDQVNGNIGTLPFVLVANKIDLVDEWKAPESELNQIARRGVGLMRTSAKTGEGVEEAFQRLAESIV